MSLHLPLFAAAHAMLNSARPDAPRLLAVDEAFAGVDDKERGPTLVTPPSVRNQDEFSRTRAADSRIRHASRGGRDRRR